MGSDCGVQEIKCDSERRAPNPSCIVLRSHIRLGVSEKKKIKNDDCRAAGRINPVSAVQLYFTSLIQCVLSNSKKKKKQKKKRRQGKTEIGVSVASR